MSKQDKVKALLEKVGLPFIEIEVYGNQITVECKAEKTSRRWAGIIGKFATIRGVIKTTRESKKNTNTVLLPDRYEIYRVYAKI